VTDLKRSPLHERHVALGAKMADFGGWEMPIEYPGGGGLKEHAVVREGVGIFDVSHLGKGVVRGPGALDFVNARLTNDLRRVGFGQAQYTLCCDRETGGVIDDLIAYVRSEDEVFLIPNAANTSAVISLLQADAPESLEVVDLHTTFAVIAVQGPKSPQLMAAMGLPTDHDYMSFTRSGEMTVCRTGYTGELGFELLPTWDEAGPVWDELLEKGAVFGVLPCGLGARDTLRTEMGTGEVGLGGRLGQAGVLGTESTDQGTGRGTGAVAVGPGVPGPRYPAQPHERPQGRSRDREGHQRDLLPDAPQGHRTGPPGARHRGG
jgi:aminomethyltransferase